MPQKNHRYVFIVGEELDLCVLDKDRHMEKCLAWINDPDINNLLTTGRWPMNRPSEEAWFDATNSDSVNLAIEKKDGTYIGNIGFHKINPLSRTAEIGIVIGEKNEWGKGYGSAAEKMLIAHGFQRLNLFKIYAAVFEENIGSLKAAQKAGMHIEGQLKNHIYANGRYQDVICLAIFREDQ